MTQWVDHTDPSGWFTISPISDSRIDSFLGTIRGPVGTPYEAGIFHVRINTDMPYPFAAPRVWFLTRILHPNVDAHGAICMSTFGNSNENGWSPAMTMETLLVSVASLLDEPNWDDPVDGVLPLEWTPDREEFKVRAREWTRRYATGRIVYPGERDDGFYTVSEVPTNSQAATLVETE
ncbi:ubiquitin-conjugating enzyme/RWD-like protein [Dactylonectria estremocensis]|uniref:Ubiquitin-conjugating enzyme/RWD-like protein n=1 Tax=Dactylonectria estremocensis TaxID=1079267 RepID=A0A9P9FKT2_9HYPO|nr:ubiquitin-conjugating enzyme/RWD-like protein [Dactylonectria estremocensis]